jgi:hypothetical protein
MIDSDHMRGFFDNKYNQLSGKPYVDISENSQTTQNRQYKYQPSRQAIAVCVHLWTNSQRQIRRLGQIRGQFDRFVLQTD